MTHQEKLQKAALEWDANPDNWNGSVQGIAVKAFLAGGTKRLELLAEKEGEHAPRVFRVSKPWDGTIIAWSINGPEKWTSDVVVDEYVPLTELVATRAEAAEEIEGLNAAIDAMGIDYGGAKEKFEHDLAAEREMSRKLVQALERTYEDGWHRGITEKSLAEYRAAREGK